DVAVQVARLLGPPLAVRVIVAPAASACVCVSDQDTGVPSTLKSTPTIVPVGVGAVPWFFTVALKVTACPGVELVGERPISVTIRSPPAAGEPPLLGAPPVVSAPPLVAPPPPPPVVGAPPLVAPPPAAAAPPD